MAFVHTTTNVRWHFTDLRILGTWFTGGCKCKIKLWTVAILKISNTKIKNKMIEKEVSNSESILKDIVEKPQSNAPSNLAVVGRYVLSSKIFKYLKNLEPSVGGEVQLTDAIKLMLNDEKVIGYLYEGTKFDCGSRHGYVNAIKHLAKEILDE